jgi:hypothetical protein
MRKTIEFDEETHQMIKEQSQKAKMPMRLYIRLCVIRCKSESGVNVKDK